MFGFGNEKPSASKKEDKEDFVKKDLEDSSPNNKNIVPKEELSSLDGLSDNEVLDQYFNGGGIPPELLSGDERVSFLISSEVIRRIEEDKSKKISSSERLTSLFRSMKDYSMAHVIQLQKLGAPLLISVLGNNNEYFSESEKESEARMGRAGDNFSSFISGKRQKGGGYEDVLGSNYNERAEYTGGESILKSAKDFLVEKIKKIFG